MKQDDIPKHFKKKGKIRKKYGIEKYSNWFFRWGVWKWYETEQQRDQAFEDLHRHTSNARRGVFNVSFRYRKVNRE